MGHPAAKPPDVSVYGGTSAFIWSKFPQKFQVVADFLGSARV
jgi:hypothetical protein